jgi:hypothetical protein
VKNKLIILLRIFLSILALPASFILSDLQLTAKTITFEFAITGLRGLPIPYPYIYSVTRIGWDLNPIIYIDLLFWLFLFNLLLDKWLFKKILTPG